MSVRTWLYNLLTSTPALQVLVEDRVFAKRTMTSSVESTPYIVYKLGQDTDEQLSEESSAHRQYFQIWVHDYSDLESADYMVIDEVLEVLKVLLKNASSPADRVLSVQVLETSQDLNDETLGTVFKYLRCIAIMGG